MSTYQFDAAAVRDSLVEEIRRVAREQGFSKVVLAFCMLFGRLEIYAMIILFSPKTWKSIKR